MSHSSEKRWDEVSQQVAAAAQNVRDQLQAGEEVYQRLTEVYDFSGGSAQALADQLYREVWSTREADPQGNPGVFDTEASIEEKARVTDLINAMGAVHELYQAAANVAVTQKDRLTDLRRMI